MGANLFWALTLICFAVSLTQPIDFQSISETVSENEMLPFLRYHVLKGYELKEVYQPNYPQFGDEFSIQLYDYFLENHLISDTDIILQVEDTICFPSGECIDLDDPGVYPGL